jgi:hypothetical protein
MNQQGFSNYLAIRDNQMNLNYFIFSFCRNTFELSSRGDYKINQINLIYFIFSFCRNTFELSNRGDLIKHQS